MATTTKALKKENEELRQEIGEIQKKIDKIAEDISRRNEKSEGINVGDQVVSTLEKDKSVEFLSQIDQNKVAAGVFLDLSKTFDTILKYCFINWNNKVFPE